MPQESTEKHQTWLRPAARQGGLQPGLYLVATPIGNLGDITLRALDTLAAADLIVCEDTRLTGKLLSAFGLRKAMTSYNDHNADRKRAALLKRLREGLVVAFVSDAGTPLVSDPGFKLVRACREEGLAVTALPGANAPLTALQLSGIAGDKFCFLGFLPPKEKARRAVLQQWSGAPGALIAFETAQRLIKALADIEAVLGDRPVAVVRELTKIYEEVRRASASELRRIYEDEGPPKGEIVLVIAPPPECADADADAVRERLERMLETMGTKEAAAQAARETGQSRKALYALALEIARRED